MQHAERLTLAEMREFLSASDTFSFAGASAVHIGERRKPQPCGKPGCLRAGTAPQGGASPRQGIDHIHAAGTVTQGRIVDCCETISGAHFLSV